MVGLRLDLMDKALAQRFLALEFEVGLFGGIACVCVGGRGQVKQV